MRSIDVEQLYHSPAPTKNQANQYSSQLFLLGASAFQDGGGILRESVDGITDDKATTLPKFF